jgi:hypothetical protein
MEITTQLALFLANKPGTLAAVCDALAAEKINIFGLTISDTVDHAVVRMVVSDYKKALSIFEERVDDVLTSFCQALLWARGSSPLQADPRIRCRPSRLSRFVSDPV